MVGASLIPALATSSARYVVGAKTFTEQYVLSALLTDRLQASGLSAVTRSGLGSSVIYEALRNGDIDLYVDYSGTLWANQLHHSEMLPREPLLDAFKKDLAQQKVTLLGGLGFENAYALVMPRKTAEALHIR